MDFTPKANNRIASPRQADFSAEEFAARRERVFDAIGSEAHALLQSALAPRGYVIFRQTNEFFYCCGLETPQSYLLLNGGERTAALYPTATDRQKGGDDTTFTPTGANGAWKLYSATPDDTVRKYRPADAKYLFPLYRGLNTGTKGVVYFGGTVGVSGTLRGKVTMYAHSGTIVILDDVRYADDPSRGVCADILGMISDNNVVVADNAINTPQNVASTGTTWKSLGLTPDLYVHAVIMTLNTSFTVQNYGTGPTNALTCQTSNDGRGCLYLTGGIIQQDRGAVGLSSGQGYVKRYSYDRCAAVNPPPYFPTTGRFADNRYFELNPVGFDVTALFKSLTPGS